MQSIQQILKNNPLSNCSGTPAKTEQTTSILNSKKTEQQRPAATSSSSRAAALPEKVIDALFIRFTTIYGHAWSSLHKEGEFIGKFKREWAEALCGFDTHIIKEALLYCRTRYRLPPNIPEFIECCKLFENRRPSKIFQRESKPRDIDAAKQHLQKIKQILNMK